MTMHPLLEKLSGGDRRSIGRSNQVVGDVIADTKLFEVIFDGIMNEDPLIRMRCADAVEKITLLHPELLQKYKKTIIQVLPEIE